MRDYGSILIFSIFVCQELDGITRFAIELNSDVFILISFFKF